MRRMQALIGNGHLFLLAALAFLIGPATAARAQLGLPSTQYPNPRLSALVPCGGKAGSTLEVAFLGTDLEEPQALLFGHPGIKAEPIIPPAPPADPKKPTPPPPMPPVTKFKVTIAADVPVGNHDARLVGKYGVSNPRAFVVGDLAEVQEKEPNNDVAEAQRVEVNSTVNGVIAAPTDVDYFVFAGKKGQRVVVSCLATSIDSRLHAGLEVYDANGRLLAQNRNYHGNDALTDVAVPADGDYYVRLFEFTHTQGSPEHFYRLTITTGPWIDAVHPCVVPPGKPSQVTVYGRNLPGGQPDPAAVVDGRVLEKAVVTATPPADPAAAQRLDFRGRIDPPGAFLDGFEFRVKGPAGTSNPFLLTYALAPVVLDNEANDAPETAQPVTVPCEIAGRIEKKKDRDWYVFTAKKGEVYHIEVLSHRHGAATDLRFLVRNVAAKSDIFEVDDNPDVLSNKLFTRTEDPPPYRFVVPADGPYQLMVTSALADVLAGPRQFYRVRITPEVPDFRLVAMAPDYERPDSGQLLAGGNLAFTVYAWRHGNFTGPIALTVEGLPKGVTCPPQVLAPGQRQATLVLSAAPDAPRSVGPVIVKGTATINGQPAVREARSASVTWPIPQGQNIPTLTRLDSGIFLAVCEKAPFNLTATLDKAVVVQGDKANFNVKLTRLDPEFKSPLTIQVIEAPPGAQVNNNQPFTLNPGKDDGQFPLVVPANVPPGVYTVVLRGQGQLPFNKDPKAPPAQRQPINIVLPATPVALTVLPKQVATLALATPNPMVKVGQQAELVVRVARQFDYAGEFKVQVMLPPAAQGVSIAEATIPAGQNEVKLILKAAADAAPGPRADLVLKVTAILNGNVPTVHELKFAVNVVK